MGPSLFRIGGKVVRGLVTRGKTERRSNFWLWPRTARSAFRTPHGRCPACPLVYLSF